MKKIIWGNCIVKNEDRYLWFAVKSVIDHLDKLIIWDTGSTDNTIQIIKLLKQQYPQKIEFKEVGEVSKDSFTDKRQEMLELSKSDWIFILDGDEVWWEDSVKNIVEQINEDEQLEVIVSPVYILVGDIYHYQPEEAGQYQLLGKKGHFNIRAVNKKITGLHFARPYGEEGLFDKDNRRIQERKTQNLKFINKPYLHFTHLKRSSKEDGNVMMRKEKYKYEIGIPFLKDFKFPESLYLERPYGVPSPWRVMDNLSRIRSLIETPLKKIKRKLTS